MKKVIVVSKTHLDLGFTDYAENIYNRYIESYIPNSINIAKQLNSDGKKRFVWSTGSWLIKEALQNEKIRPMVVEGLKNGDISALAMPFTTHTELLDFDTLDYGLSIIDEIDKITGRKTVSAKMTDVPGHTIGLLPALVKHGIKLLHIGVNGASALAKLPPCFVWKRDNCEVIVIYSGDYGGAYESEYIDKILYFNHTLDNRGAGTLAKEKARFDAIKNRYPDCEVIGGRLDDITELLWQVKEKLPVITEEIGDTWIHGVATDPYKTAALKELIGLKNKWLNNGSLSRDSEEYINLADNILCIAEHTWGMDMKTYFADYENYLRKDFERAKANDEVKIRHVFRDFPQNFLSFINQKFGDKKRRAYGVIEKSWDEQRNYLVSALSKLSLAHHKEATTALAKLRPKELPIPGNDNLITNQQYNFGDNSVTINGFGGIKQLKINGTICVENNANPTLDYVSYGKDDYDYWLKNYTRNIKQTYAWAIGDFARPCYGHVDKRFRHGRFPYTMLRGSINANSDNLAITVQLKIDDYCYEQLGAPKGDVVEYVLNKEKLTVKLTWTDKPANRLTESINFRLYPYGQKIEYVKIRQKLNPYNVIENGNRNLSCVEKIIIKQDNTAFEIINKHSPLIGLGKGKILHFDNKYEDFRQDGISYILYNNVWGTNFPLWYSDNAYFEYDIAPINL